MPATPNLPPLPAVREELEVVRHHFPQSEGSLQLVGLQATRADVLAAMTSHSWVHLACHAWQAHEDPDDSGFVLSDGTLTITDLAAQATQERDLAFLSACETAAGSLLNLDENIHLAAAMQFIGYRQVIATMWTIADSITPRVADAFYGELRNSETMDPARAAESLHHAVNILRIQEHVNNPLLWAPYIHLGG